MNSSTSYLMSMLCKSSSNKYVIMVKKRYRQDYEKYDKTFFFLNSLQSIGTKIVFYLKNYHIQRTSLRLV